MPTTPDPPRAEPPAVPPSPAARASRDLGRIIQEARFELVSIEEATEDLAERARELRREIAAGGDRQSELQAVEAELTRLLGYWHAAGGRLEAATKLADRPAAK